MFICYKCGYKDLSDESKSRFCPVCRADNSIPKCSLVLFLLLLSFIFSTFISFFKDDLDSIYIILIILIGIFIPLSIFENIKRKSHIVDGFKIPNTPDDIIKRNPRVPQFKEYIYVAGMKNDEGIKKILLEVHDDSLNIYHKKLKEVLAVKYSDIVDLILQNECEFKESIGKGATFGTLFGLMGGFGVGVLMGILNSFNIKDCLVLEIQFLEDGILKSLYITENKHKLKELVLQLEDKINSKC